MGLNRIGISNLNRQLGDMLQQDGPFIGMGQKDGPFIGMPCYTWVQTAIAASSRAKAEEVVKAWEQDIKDAEEWWAKPEKQESNGKPEKKSEAKPEKPKPKPEKAAAANKPEKPLGLRKCDYLDFMYESIDPNSTAPCEP